MTTPTASVEAAIRAAAEHTTELLPELDFLRAHGVLTVDVGVRVTGVRIDVRTGHPIDVQSLVMTGLVREPTQPAITVSGWRHGREVDARTILRAEPKDKPTLLTPAADHCWAEIVWRDPVEPESIVIRQATSAFSHRGSGIVMSVRDAATGCWRILHDGAERIEAARAEVLARAAAETWSRNENDLKISLVRAMFSAAVGEYVETQAVMSELRRGDVTDEGVVAFKAVVNPTFLAQREREWTVHGATRTFRFWSELEKVDYLRQAAQVCQDLQGLTSRACFGFGAALAVVRDHDLIPHDDDLDIVIALGSDVAGSLPEALTLLESYLRAAGYQVTGDAFAHRKVGRKGQKKVDVFVGIFEGRTKWRREARRRRAEIAWYPGPRGALTVGEVFPTSTGEILGVAVPLPRDPERYLQTQYGEGWRVPNPQFQHHWGRGRYKDLARTPPPSQS